MGFLFYASYFNIYAYYQHITMYFNVLPFQIE